jgi:ribosomal protein S27E
MSGKKRDKAEIKQPSSIFLEIECRKCKKKYTVFSKVTTEVACDKCGEVLVLPTGGHSHVKAKILNLLD